MHPDALLPRTNTEVIYERIDSILALIVANRMKGSRGPPKIEADIWTNFARTKFLGKAPQQLCLAITDTAEIFCTEENHPNALEQ